jgi:predicted ABC-type ATPase
MDSEPTTDDEPGAKAESVMMVKEIIRTETGYVVIERPASDVLRVKAMAVVTADEPDAELAALIGEKFNPNHEPAGGPGGGQFAEGDGGGAPMARRPAPSGDSARDLRDARRALRQAKAALVKAEADYDPSEGGAGALARARVSAEWAQRWVGEAAVRAGVKANPNRMDVTNPLDRERLDYEAEVGERIAGGLSEALGLVREALGEKFNPNHDELGRFSEGGGGGASPATEEDEPYIRIGPTGIPEPISAKVSVVEPPDSQHIHSRNGVYRPERAALHQRMVDAILKDVPSVKEPTFYVMGGGPGSGKTSLLASGLFDVPAFGQAAYLGADDIKTGDPRRGLPGIPEYRDGLDAGDLRVSEHTHEESSDVTRRAMTAALSKRMNIVLDGTGDSTYSSVEKKVNAARAAGLRVEANYVTIPIGVALDRAIARARKSGRLPPENVIRNTHVSVSRVFSEALRRGLFDKATLWDNTRREPRLVVTYDGDRTTVHEPALWAEFLAKGNG